MFNPRRSTRLASAAATTPPAAAPPAAAAAAAAAPPAANESSNGEGVKKRIKTSASAAIKPKSFFRPNKSKGDQPKLAYDKRPTNIAAKEKQKKAGKLWGYSFLKPGRPSKTVVTEKAVEAEDVSESNPEDIISRVKQQPPSRGAYQKYEGKTEEAMQAAVHAYILAGDDSPFAAAKAAAHDITPNYDLKRSTVLSRVEKEKKRREEAASNDEHHFDRKQPGAGRGLTSNDDREMIQSFAANCDNKNDGLTRKGMIQLVSKVTGATIEKAKEHYKYLVRSGKLNKLKRGGRTVKAQATTTNRTAVTTEKLFRTYLSQEEGKCKLCW